MKTPSDRRDSTSALQWVDAMERIYPDRWPAPDPGASRLEALPGGCAAVVLAVRTGGAAGGVRLRWLGYGDDAAANWPMPRVFALKPVRVAHNTIDPCKQVEWRPEAAAHVIRRAPFQVHEAMWPGETLQTDGCRTEGFVLFWEFPVDCAPGSSSFAVAIEGPGFWQTCSGRIRVHAAALRGQRLPVVNWWRNDRVLHPWPEVEPWSPRHWRLIEQGLRWLQAGRQTDILVPFAEAGGNLVDVFEEQPGRFRFDFARMDRFVRLALRLGYRQLLGGHLCHKKHLPAGGCDLAEPLLHVSIPCAGGAEREEQLSMKTERARAYLEQFIRALRRHLARRGWADIWLQHVADEPFSAVAESYCATCEWLRERWPGVRLIDAASHCASGLALDIPVPEIDGVELHKAFFERLRTQGGKAVWLYTCCCPTGAWPNRFLDFHLNKGLLLPWFCDHYGCSGYLHWGGNQWGEGKDMYADTGFQGDGFILMPGPGGPVPTLRWLALRMGIEDYECLQELRARGEAGAKQAAALRRRLITGPTDYRYDCPTVRQVRQALYRALDRAGMACSR